MVDVLDAPRAPEPDRRVQLAVGLLVGVLVAAVVAAYFIEERGAVPRDSPAAESADDRLVPVEPEAERPAAAADAWLAEFAMGYRALFHTKHIIDVFSETLDSDEVRYGFAYRNEDSLRVVDASGITDVETEVAHGYLQLTGVRFLSTASETWAIDETDRTNGYFVSSIYDVVDLDGGGTLGVIDLDGPDRTIDLLADGLPAASVDIPATTDVLGVDGYGVLLMPRTGGTYALRPGEREPSLISTDRALAATTALVVFESCDESLRCVAYGETLGATDNTVRYELPHRKDARYWPSPDGRWIILDDGADAQLLSLIDPTDSRILSSSIEEVSWSASSEFAAILRGRTIEIIPTGSGDHRQILLPEAPEDGAFTVFETRLT